jgi:uncharacterized RDD family membrane protein YckC
LTPGSGFVAAPQFFPAVPKQFPSPVAGLEHPLEALGYASMGERFLAFLCDASIWTALVGCFLAAFYLRSSLDFEGLKETALWVIPIAYMTLAEFFFHGTIGKRLLRIQLRADSSEPRYPSLFRILLRESLGKFLCAFIFGIGFLAGTSHPKKKTWADRIAGTVVVKTGVASSRFKALLVPVLICTYFALGTALTTIPSAYKKNLTVQLRKTEATIDDLHEQILQSVFAGKSWPAKASQQNVTTLLAKLDEYDRLLAGERELVWKSRKLTKPDDYRDYYENKGLDVYEKVIPLRQEIALLVRRHAQMVVAFDPQKQKWDEVLKDRRQMMHEINSRNNQINQIGGVYLPRTVRFEGFE